MKVLKFLVLFTILGILWGEVIVLKDGRKIDCTILTTSNDSLIIINHQTEQIAKFAFDDIVRVEHPAARIAKVNKSIEYGFFGAIIGGVTAITLQSIADVDDARIVAPLYGICISCGIVLGIRVGGR